MGSVGVLIKERISGTLPTIFLSSQEFWGDIAARCELSRLWDNFPRSGGDIPEDILDYYPRRSLLVAMVIMLRNILKKIIIF
jgi:hypothetical protein